MVTERLKNNKNPLEILKKELANSRALIDAEFIRSEKNVWLSCFVTRVQILMGEIEIIKDRNMLPPEEVSEIESKLKVTLHRQRALYEEYRGQRDIPEELKQELIASLESLNTYIA